MQPSYSICMPPNPRHSRERTCPCLIQIPVSELDVIFLASAHFVQPFILGSPLIFFSTVACWDLCFRYPLDLVIYNRICNTPHNQLVLRTLYVLLQFNHSLIQFIIILNFDEFIIRGYNQSIVRYYIIPSRLV